MAKKSILITGSSSGIGRATARHFSNKGWHVAATMRTPAKETEMQSWPGVKLYTLDVTDEESIQTAVSAAIKDFGHIDVVCNNVGYGAIGIFEKATQEQIRRDFETNVFGSMNVIRAILPHFRQRRVGTIINITSMGGQITFPVYSVYHATKWAMEGFSESLWFELRHLGIRVRCIQPGAIKTDFYTRSQEVFENPAIKDYDNYEQVTLANTQKAGEDAPGPEVVAKAIYKAATDRSWKLRYPVGGLSPLLLNVRKVLPLGAFMKIVGSSVEKGFKK